MSKLPNAPLIEVIFELHWHSKNPEEVSSDLSKFQMCLGGMLTALQKDFPNFVDLRGDGQIPLAIFADKPTHRFMPNGINPINYPLYQLGPGVLTVNTIDEKYDWDQFSALILKVNYEFNRLFQFDDKKEMVFVLKYLDFYKIDLRKDIRQLLKDLFKFNIDLGVAIPKTVSPLILNIESGFETPSGIVNFAIKRGGLNRNGENIDGIIFENGIQLKIDGANYLDTLNKWLIESHEVISTFFKEITKGPTYESFK